MRIAARGLHVADSGVRGDRVTTDEVLSAPAVVGLGHMEGEMALDEFPPLETPVVVTMDDGTEFRAMRIYVEDGDGACTAWATADEFEPAAPPCWDDGVCWASNADEKPSRQPVAWRHI